MPAFAMPSCTETANMRVPRENNIVVVTDRLAQRLIGCAERADVEGLGFNERHQCGADSSGMCRFARFSSPIHDPAGRDPDASNTIIDHAQNRGLCPLHPVCQPQHSFVVAAIDQVVNV